MENEDELITDLKFLFHNRSDTVDQFMEEALSLFDQHLNKRLADYQERTLKNATQYFQGEMATILLKTRQDYRKEAKKNATLDW